MGSCCITQGAQPGALWWPKRVGLGEGGREAQEGREICGLTADSHYCTEETKHIVKQLSSNFKKYFNK